jgi:hypothetical protein
MWTTKVIHHLWDIRLIMNELHVMRWEGSHDCFTNDPDTWKNWQKQKKTCQADKLISSLPMKYIDRVCNIYYVKLPQLPSFQMAWYSSNILYLYVGDVLFESQPGYQLFWGVTWFLEPIQANPGVLSQLHHDRFLPNTL